MTGSEKTDSNTLTAEIDAVGLQQAFELFSKETSRLEKAYSALREQFKQVNTELEDTNRSLNAKVIELDTATRYLNSILSNMSQGILFIDLGGDVTTYNAAAERMLGKSAEEVLFHPFEMNFDETLFGFSIKEALAQSEAPATSYTRHHDVELEVSTTFVLQGNVATRGLIVLIKDITEVRRLQAAAQRHDRLKDLGEMAASVAHEIRNPLGGIRGFAALLARDLDKSPELKQMANYIVSGTEALDNLVTNVLNYSRPVHMRPELTDIRSFLERTTQLVKADEGMKNIEISIRCPEAALQAPLDQHQIQACLLNLILNASQAMDGTGTITLDACTDDGELNIAVSDTGCGIPEDQLERVFSPFFTTKASGNGFGLSEVHKIIEAHGGSIEVTSQVGEGTTFTCRLPTI